MSTERMSVLVKDLTKMILATDTSHDTGRQDIVEHLLARGYTIDEIDEAIAWLYSILDEKYNISENKFTIQRSTPKPVRVLARSESLKLTREAHGLLMQLYHYNRLTHRQLEALLQEVQLYPIGGVTISELEKLIAQLPEEDAAMVALPRDTVHATALDMVQ